MNTGIRSALFNSALTISLITRAAASPPGEVAALPLDVIGLRVATLTAVRVGVGYRTGDTVTIAGGGGASAAYRDGRWFVAKREWYGCAPSGLVGPEAAPASGGTGAVFTLTMLRPVAYGMRRLGRCYDGPLLTVARRDTGASSEIPFLPDGTLDTIGADSFTHGTVQEVVLLKDQGGGGLDAVPAGRPAVLYPPRRLGNARSIILDGAPFVIPARFGVDVRDNTLAAIVGARSADYSPGAIDLGFGPSKVWLSQGDSRDTLAYTTGTPGSRGIGIADSLDSLRDDPNLLIGTTLSGAVSLRMNGHSAHATTTDTGNTIGGGLIGQHGASDGVAFVAVPFGLSPARMQALETSLATGFGIRMQGNDMLVVVGHSLNEGTGTAYQQGWPRQMAQQLDRAGLHIVNVAHAGYSCTQALTSFEQRGLPALATMTGRKVVSILCGDNDFAADTSLTPIRLGTLYDRIAAVAHAAGARTLCIEPPYADRSFVAAGGGPAYTAAEANTRIVGPFSALIAARLGSACDAVVDEKLLPAFDRPAGPFSPTAYADGIHPTNESAGAEARMLGAALSTLMR